MSFAFNRTIKNLNKTKQHVSFATHNTVRLYKDHKEPLMITYDSGSNGNYLRKKDCVKAGLPILQPSTHMVGVANGGTSQVQHVTQLPFHKQSVRARQADTFQNFPTLLMSVGKTSNNGTISVFTKTGVTMFKEEDVLITCKGKPILIGMRDGRERYQIPLMQQRGQWQPRHPSKQARKALRQANSVYGLPSTKQAIKWMHAVCGYLVKSTWLKAIKAGNYVGWPMLMEHNVQKYYPEATKTAKGHLNQTRKNVCSTKEKPAPLETCNISQLHGKKVRNVYTKMYKVRETMFSNQTSQLPTQSQRGNKYIMVMVEINSNAILIKPMKSCKDAEMI